MSDNIFKLVTASNEFKFWSSFNITRSIETFDMFSFDAPFGDDSLIKDIIKPLSYLPAQIFVDDELLSTVVIVNVNPTLGIPNSISVDGYGKPGILNDCSVAHSNYPLEFNNQTLQQIADKLCSYFDIGSEFRGSPLSIGSFASPISGAAFEKVRLDSGEKEDKDSGEIGDDKPLDLLIKLAKKRSFLVSNTNDGKLLFWKAAIGRTTVLKQGHTPLLSVTPNINPQEFYSEITGLSPGGLDSDEPEAVTIKNPLCKAYRPLVYKVDQELSGADLQNAVRWKMGRMIANAISYSVEVQGIRDQYDKIWEPNTLINLTAPGAFVNNETTFLIKDLTINKGDSETTSMNLVLPEAYNGKIPTRLPWD